MLTNKEIDNQNEANSSFIKSITKNDIQKNFLKLTFSIFFFALYYAL